eukprot:14289_6
MFLRPHIQYPHKNVYTFVSVIIHLLHQCIVGAKISWLRHRGTPLLLCVTTRHVQSCFYRSEILLQMSSATTGSNRCSACYFLS